MKGAARTFLILPESSPMTKPGHHRNRDPYQAREQLRYKDPIPSREFIIETLTESGVPLNEQELIKLLGIGRQESVPFARRLAAMERDGQILRNRKNAILVTRKLALIAGRVDGHPDGFGFILPDDGSSDLYLNPREMRKVLHRDRVMVREAGVDRRGRREAEIVEVTERANLTVVGAFKCEHEVSSVVASDRRISQTIAVPRGEELTAKPGEIVVVEIIVPPQPEQQPVGRVIEVLGRATDPGIEIEIALRKHDLPFEFSQKSRAQAARSPMAVRFRDTEGRLDLRELPLVTIDGETAKDFDDAVWAERRGKGFRLVVAIADVSHYVKPDDALDIDARERGTSVYFPRRVIPMLPEDLSNGICSLNPDVDRLCLACDMSISMNGEIIDYSFRPAVMRSKARLTYAQVSDALTDPQSKAAHQLGTLLTSLKILHELFRSLLKARARRGAIDFDTSETKIIFDAFGKIKQIVAVPRNDAHRLIEECMLAANVSASDFLSKAKHPVLYRIHEEPTQEKLASLREFLKEFGLDLRGGSKPIAKDYSKLLDSIRSRPDFHLLQTVLLRSLQQARYSPENCGHFGLAYDAYVHFTSPIRRYPDLVVHRAIKAVLDGKQYSPGNWIEFGTHCSQTERRADDATREVEAWLKCYYMRDRVGEVFDGTVSGVAGFGVFVSLHGVYVEGMVHVSELGSDYFQFDASKHQLLGERTGKRYRLGDRIKVKIARVDLDSRRIDFVLFENIEIKHINKKTKTHHIRQRS